MKYQNLTLIYGPMFSGKSKKLIEIYNSINAKKLVFKPELDTRNKDVVKSRDGEEINAHSLKDISEVYHYLKKNKAKNLFFDETFMFSGNIISTIIDLLEKKYRIFIATLDTNYLGVNFKNIYNLFFLVEKENLIRLYSKCNKCNNQAKWSIRITNGVIDDGKSPVILADDKNNNSYYETRCDKHLPEFRKAKLSLSNFEFYENKQFENKKVYSDQ